VPNLYTYFGQLIPGAGLRVVMRWLYPAGGFAAYDPIEERLKAARTATLHDVPGGELAQCVRPEPAAFALI